MISLPRRQLELNRNREHEDKGNERNHALHTKQHEGLKTGTLVFLFRVCSCGFVVPPFPFVFQSYQD